MGIQAFIVMADLQAAATDIRVHTVRAPSHDEDVQPSFTWQEVEVRLEGTEEPLWFNLSGDGSVAWIDVNHWGSNRSRYLPALAKAGVEWVEG